MQFGANFIPRVNSSSKMPVRASGAGSLGSSSVLPQPPPPHTHTPPRHPTVHHSNSFLTGHPPPNRPPPPLLADASAGKAVRWLSGSRLPGEARSLPRATQGLSGSPASLQSLISCRALTRDVDACHTEGLADS